MTDAAIWRVIRDVAAAQGWQDRDAVLHIARAKLPAEVTMQRIERLWKQHAEITGAI